MLPIEQRQVIDKIKNTLKLKKITYKNLSKGTGISESSLKKIFAGGDCSFSRLIEITNHLDLHFFDLIGSIERTSGKVYFQLSHEQERFFADNLNYFLFFHKIFRDGMTVPQAQAHFDIDDKYLWQILRKLESFKLIEITDFPNARVLVSGGLNFRVEGPSLSTPVTSPFSRLYFGKVTEKNYNWFLGELRELHDEFSNLVVKDRKYSDPDELLDVTWLLGMGSCHGFDLAYNDK